MPSCTTKEVRSCKCFCIWTTKFAHIWHVMRRHGRKLVKEIQYNSYFVENQITISYNVADLSDNFC